MAARFGAHEVMEIHEVLTSAIDGMNQFQLYRPHVKDQQLMQILDHQLQFMLNEYNNMVQMIGNQGAGQAMPYRAPKNVAPVYGLDNPGTHAPNLSMEQMDDRDVSSGMLGCHKASAGLKMMAALECADPGLRRTLQQAAMNCSEQAYEVWQYMNHNGYYQVPTLVERTMNAVLQGYEQGDAAQPGDSFQGHAAQQYGGRASAQGNVSQYGSAANYNGTHQNGNASQFPGQYRQ
jgi:spore coat protein CotF